MYMGADIHGTPGELMYTGANVHPTPDGLVRMVHQVG